MSYQQTMLQYLADIRKDCATLLGSANIYVFGTGAVAALCQSALRHEKITPVAYVDNDVNKQGRVYEGRPVIALKDVPADATVLIAVQNPERRNQIERQMSTRGGYLYIDTYFWARHLEDVKQTLSLLENDESVETYAELLLRRMKNRPVISFSIRKNFALNSFAGAKPEEVFVDCGAYVGDTVEKYLWEREGCFSKIFALEPFARNYQAMLARFERLRREWALSDDQLVAVCGGAGAQDMDCCIGTSGGGLGAVVQEQGDHIHIYKLDDLFADQTVGYIKADIEGSEYDMLLGAENVLKRDRPLLSICLYHTPADFYQIPLYLNRLQLGYKFQVRHHSPTFSETVLYAYC